MCSQYQAAGPSCAPLVCDQEGVSLYMSYYSACATSGYAAFRSCCCGPPGWRFRCAGMVTVTQLLLFGRFIAILSIV
ncbi:hypothetical protein GQ53DRAFT_527054 [Thozetella sp. PMI_491]|nr:hypothetical protein GQ53DRAFT_527054 [Thozetella sp. PMI_491]